MVPATNDSPIKPPEDHFFRWFPFLAAQPYGLRLPDAKQGFRTGGVRFIASASFTTYGEYMPKVDTRGKSKAVAGFGERMTAATTAKKALLEKWQWQANKVDVNDPAFLEQQAARQAASALRAERDSQRKAERDAVKAQAIADRKAALEAAQLQTLAEQAAREADKVEAAALLIAQTEQRKAARDARYAARKARK
jgi:hypothetical protein